MAWIIAIKELVFGFGFRVKANTSPLNIVTVSTGSFRFYCTAVLVKFSIFQAFGLIM